MITTITIIQFYSPVSGKNQEADTELQKDEKKYKEMFQATPSYEQKAIGADGRI